MYESFSLQVSCRCSYCKFADNFDFWNFANLRVFLYSTKQNLFWDRFRSKAYIQWKMTKHTNGIVYIQHCRMITNSRNLLTTFIVSFSRNKIFGKHSKISLQLLQECENLILELVFAQIHGLMDRQLWMFKLSFSFPALY